MKAMGTEHMERNCTGVTPCPWFMKIMGDRNITSHAAICKTISIFLFMTYSFYRIHIGGFLCRDVSKEYTDEDTDKK